MYKPKIYTEKDKDKIATFIENNPFAVITGVAKNGMLVATQVPLIFDECRQNLQGHIMKATEHYKAFIENPEVLVLFSGANAYISASWYKPPYSASTWNYMSVQVKGKMKFLNATEFEKMMTRFTLKFENNNTNSPTYYDNLPLDYRKKHMEAIAGFTIEIESFEATFKLSQDKDKEHRDIIIKKLKEQSFKEQWLASEMQRNSRI
jgi:transcriptional regulator